MPLSWHAGLNELIPLLASLYPDSARARMVALMAGIDPTEVDLTGAPKAVWLRLVEEANRRDAVPKLLEVAGKDFPNIDFDTLRRQLGNPRVAPAPEFAVRRGGTDNAHLEKVTGRQPTFLPVHFLQIGLLRARSVARVDGPSGPGTGFLIGDNILITNHHVIPTREEAKNTKIWFNYQEDAQGRIAETSELDLEPELLFATSPANDGDDWTAVRVHGNPNGQWGALELTEAAVATNDYVNVVQHPGGLPKQIAIYHNLVVYSDDSRVQYMTDTLPGSSGAPVFDSHWRVVALHHSGGWLAEPGTRNVFFRNEGIAIRALLRGLKEHKIRQ